MLYVNQLMVLSLCRTPIVGASWARSSKENCQKCKKLTSCGSFVVNPPGLVVLTVVVLEGCSTLLSGFDVVAQCVWRNAVTGSFWCLTLSVVAGWIFATGSFWKCFDSAVGKEQARQAPWISAASWGRAGFERCAVIYMLSSFCFRSSSARRCTSANWFRMLVGLVVRDGALNFVKRSRLS